METEDKTLIERERCKEIVKRKFETANLMRDRRRHNSARAIIPISEFNRLKERILFLIDNPDYQRTTQTPPLI